MIRKERAMGFISWIKQFFASCPLHRLEIERVRVADMGAEEKKSRRSGNCLYWISSDHGRVPIPDPLSPQPLQRSGGVVPPGMEGSGELFLLRGDVPVRETHTIQCTSK